MAPNERTLTKAVVFDSKLKMQKCGKKFIFLFSTCKVSFYELFWSTLLVLFSFFSNMETMIRLLGSPKDFLQSRPQSEFVALLLLWETRRDFVAQIASVAFIDT